VTNAA